MARCWHRSQSPSKEEYSKQTIVFNTFNGRIGELEMLDEYIKQKERDIMKDVAPLKATWMNMPLADPAWMSTKEQVEALERSRKSSKAYKIVSVLKHFKANYDDEDEPDVGALNRLENNLDIYMVGFDYACKKHGATAQGATSRRATAQGATSRRATAQGATSRRATEARIAAVVRYMERMRVVDLDGFIRIAKLTAAGVKLRECMRVGRCKREQWASKTSKIASICSVITPRFPDVHEDEDPTACATMVLRELVQGWPTRRRPRSK
jgi:hypothetical protein